MHRLPWVKAGKPHGAARYGEREIVVEPRRLGKVNVVERFEQTA
jgi:hypothetical protein